MGQIYRVEGQIVNDDRRFERGWSIDPKWHRPYRIEIAKSSLSIWTDGLRIWNDASSIAWNIVGWMEIVWKQKKHQIILQEKWRQQIIDHQNRSCYGS